MATKYNYEELEKRAKNPFYTMNASELEQLEAYRAERYQPPKKHSTAFNKHGFVPPKHVVELEEADDDKTS